MGRRLCRVMLGLAFGACVVAALATAQTFEEALRGPDAFPPVVGNELCGDPCDGLPAPPADESAQDTVLATAVSADLSVEGTTEETEEDPGAFLAANGPRIRLTLRVAPGTAGPVRLAVTSGGDKVDLYAAPTGGEPLGDVLEYPSAEAMPTTLYVQALAGSDKAGDVAITLSVGPAQP